MSSTSLRLVPALAAALITASSLPARAEGDFRGVWKPDRYQPAIRTIEGQTPPLRPDARALYEKRIADRKAGRSDDPVDVCQPAGTPRIMFQPRPFMVVQTPLKVTFLHEYEHILRHVYLNEPLDVQDKDPLWQGYSVGHWDADTLVIDTAGFNGRTWLDEAGLPQSPDLKVTERLRRLGADALEDVITIDDPKVYTRAWTTRVAFKRVPHGRLAAHICTEKLFPEPADARPHPPTP